MDIKDIAGNEQAKRVIEIALVSDTPLELIGNEEALFADFVSTIPPCPCGNAGDTVKACRCGADAIRAHWEKHALVEPKLTAYTVRPAPDKILELLQGKYEGDTTATMIERVKAAQERKEPTEIEQEAWDFLKAVMNRFALNQTETAFYLGVAKDIARLANEPTVKPAHIAEAVQYRRKDST